MAEKGGSGITRTVVSSGEAKHLDFCDHARDAVLYLDYRKVRAGCQHFEWRNPGLVWLRASNVPSKFGPGIGIGRRGLHAGLRGPKFLGAKKSRYRRVMRDWRETMVFQRRGIGQD